jgi:tyrosinase
LFSQQILQQHAQEVAAKYTVDQNEWKQAAVDLRQPYWDWAANAVLPDEVILLKQVTITASNGQRVPVDNPLYHYKFHPIERTFRRPYSGWPTTLRQPTSGQPNATDNVTRLRKYALSQKVTLSESDGIYKFSVLLRAQDDITSSTYNMLTRVHTWAAFSNNTVGDGGSTSNSLEAIHNGIHGDIGGHMGNPAVAGQSLCSFSAAVVHSEITVLCVNPT